MKAKFLMLFIFLLTSISLFAQNKNIKYCEIVTGYTGGFSSRFKAEIDLGKEDSLLSIKENKIKTQLLQVNTLKSNVDVLNYMSSIGWSFIAVTSTSGYNRFYFKKEFAPSELTTR